MTSRPLAHPANPSGSIAPGALLHRDGLAALRRDEYALALSLFDRAVNAAPTTAAYYNSRGVALRRLGRLSDALRAFGRATELGAVNPQFWRNLAAAAADLGDADGAAVACRRSLDLDPVCSEAWVQLGRATHKAGRPGEAVAAYGRAIALRAGDLPALHAARFYQSLAKLAVGDFARGWKAYESRLALDLPTAGGTPARAFARPHWGGGDLAGRTLLLHAEQGLGDTIHFARFVPILADRGGGRVVLQCQRPLVPLMRGLAGAGAVIALDEAIPDAAFDVHLPLMSVPHVLGTRLETIPSRVPYLSADPAVAAAMGAAAASAAGGEWADALNVGLCWAGSPSHDSDRDRSATLAALAPLGAVAGVRLFNLLKGPATAQLASLPAGLNVIDVPGANDGMERTAGLIDHLDLVIAVDTSIAHLAGAMGKRVWVALTAAPDWRWMLGRDDSPWYPTMRLFRQDVPGDWDGLFQRMADALRELVAERAGG